MDRPAPRTPCRICGKYLRSIGTSRLNGKAHNDWATRDTHKACFTRERNAREYDVAQTMRRQNMEAVRNGLFF